MTKNEIITAFADLGIELTAKEKKQKKEILMVSTAEQNPAAGAEQKSASLGCAPWSVRPSCSKHGSRRIGRQANSLSVSFGRWRGGCGFG